MDVSTEDLSADFARFLGGERYPSTMTTEEALDEDRGWLHAIHPVGC
jgi:hypothetical protein